MKMKKVAKATKYKFNINRSVGVSSTYIYSIGDVFSRDRVKTALKNNGVLNPDEIIKRHEAEIVERQERINKTDVKFKNIKKKLTKRSLN